MKFIKSFLGLIFCFAIGFFIAWCGDIGRGNVLACLQIGAFFFWLLIVLPAIGQGVL